MGRRTCMKCGKSVGALLCRGSGCPVVIHESCIPGSVQVSDKENFYCPYCMYKQSVAEFQQAREKVLLAQREVSAFLGTETSGDKEFGLNTTRHNKRMPQNHEYFGDQERMEEGKEGSHSLRIENDAKGSERDLVHVSGASSHDGLVLSTVDEKGGFIRQCKGVPEVFECTNGIKMAGNQNNSHLFSKAGGGALSFDAVRARGRRTSNSEYLAPMPLSVAVGGVIQHFVCENENFTLDQQHPEPFHSCKVENECHEGAGSLEAATFSWSNGRSEISEQPESGACDNPPGDEVYRCGDNNIMNYSTVGRIDNTGKRSPFGVASDTRRKRLRWTNEEEDVLRKGVLIYSTGVKKNLPWRKILEFGRHVFDGSRSPTDLKTKWKLIARKEHLESNHG